MGILGNIVSAILHHAAPASTPASGSTTSSPAAPASPSAASHASTPSAAPAGSVDVEAILTKLASENHQRLDWHHSIVDLMKLLNLDSSLAARKELATELHYTGDMNDSASMNIWLHKQVMLQLEKNGGKVPDSLKH